MKLRAFLAIAVILVASAATPILAQETESTVPELSAFHEVIYPI